MLKSEYIASRMKKSLGIQSSLCWGHSECNIPCFVVCIIFVQDAHRLIDESGVDAIVDAYGTVYDKSKNKWTVRLSFCDLMLKLALDS